METIFLLSINQQLPVGYETLDEANLQAYKKNLPFKIVPVDFKNSEEVPQNVIPFERDKKICISTMYGDEICELEVIYDVNPNHSSNDPSCDETHNVYYVDSVILKCDSHTGQLYDVKTLSEMELSDELRNEISQLAESICEEKNGI